MYGTARFAVVDRIIEQVDDRLLNEQRVDRDLEFGVTLGGDRYLARFGFGRTALHGRFDHMVENSFLAYQTGDFFGLFKAGQAEQIFDDGV